MSQQFFYDGQIRRFMLQFARIFSNFQVEYGRNEAGLGTDTLVRVPVRYGDSSRQAQTIIQENSANNLPSTPLMTFYITALNYDRIRMQEPYFVSKINVRQRTYDQNTDSYETTQGNAFTIERLMPVPYKLAMNLDIWTSNTNQKMQLLEQIVTLFNPSLEIQNTDNYIDWTSLTTCDLEGVVWSNRVIPQGTENQIDIATLSFTLPIWISSPAKVKKLGVIERIVAGIFDAHGDAANAILDNDLLLGTRQLFTPYNYQVVLIGNKLQVLTQPQVVDQPNSSLSAPDIVSNSNLLWPSVLNMYGTFRPGVSQIRLDQPDDTQVVGTVVVDPNDDRFLIFTVDEDTVPQNTLDPVTAVINPLLSGPGAGLPVAQLGQRYLLTEATGSPENLDPASAWLGVDNQPLVAKANDIIVYNGSFWDVYFDSASSDNNIQYVTNITTAIQYKWIDNTWVKSYQGLYKGGEWSLVL
jgi:hypothetical protein